MTVFLQPDGKMYADAAAHSANDQVIAFPTPAFEANMTNVPDDRIECWEYAFTPQCGAVGTGGPIS